MWSSSADPQPASGPYALRARTALPLLPGTGPLDDAAVVCSGRRILAVGPQQAVLRGFSGPVTDLGDVLLVPGLVNAHSHLELAGLRGLCPAPAGFPAWATWLVGQDRRPAPPAVLDQAVAEMARSGTGAVIDVGDRSGPAVAAALDRGGLAGLVCREAFGWRPLPPEWAPTALDAATTDPGPVRAAASGHSLYATSPDNLRRARQICRQRGAPFCLHLAEHAAETQLLAQGTGPLASLLRGRVLPRAYVAPGCSPVAEAAALDLLGPDTLAVHAVWLDAADRRRLAATGAAVCLCPRSNARIGVGRADAPALAAAGIPLCLGTDSLASNDDLDLWNEVRALVAAFPDFPGPAVLEALTVTPARVLGRFGALGCLAPGAVGGLAVVPADLEPLVAPGR